MTLAAGALQITPLMTNGQTAAVDAASDYTQVVAHRGAWKTTELPENSIASLNRAIELGCMGSEFDVWMTLDDSLVINHDPDHAGLKIEQTPYRQLLETPLKNGEPLPTLHSYLTAALGIGGQTIPVLEIKPTKGGVDRALKITRAVVDMVQSFNAMDSIIFISFDYNMLLEIHRLYPKAVTQYLNGDKSPAELQQDGITGLDYHYSVYQRHPEWITDAQQRGLLLNAWTVNDTEIIDWLLANRFQAITTNEPELVARRAARHQRIYGDRQLVFADEFNVSGAPDTALWTFDTGSHGWGNHELQNYTNGDPSNVVVDNGLLEITARKDSQQPKGYSSVRMVQKKGFLYGRLEVRAQLPEGRGLWPALWLLPDHFKYGGWPASGEIDLMENVGYNPDSVFFTIHTEQYNHIKQTQKSQGVFNKSLYTQFHDYALEWTVDELIFFMDDQEVFRFDNEHSDSGYKSWPFDQPFHLLLNIAVGGDWGGKMGIDPGAFPATMLVDYVRVFQ